VFILVQCGVNDFHTHTQLRVSIGRDGVVVIYRFGQSGDIRFESRTE